MCIGMRLCTCCMLVHIQVHNTTSVQVMHCARNAKSAKTRAEQRRDHGTAKWTRMFRHYSRREHRRPCVRRSASRQHTWVPGVVKLDRGVQVVLLAEAAWRIQLRTTLRYDCVRCTATSGNAWLACAIRRGLTDFNIVSPYTSYTPEPCMMHADLSPWVLRAVHPDVKTPTLPLPAHATMH